MLSTSYSCPVCKSSQLKVLLTRMSIEGLRIRRRKCESCNHRWYTMQPPEIELPSWKVGYISGGRKLFLHESAGSPG